MNANKETIENGGMRSRLSTLWIFATLNYLYCDVVTLMDPKILGQFMAGDVGGIHVTPEFLLRASILMEIPMAMVLLSRILKYGANRWANIIAGTIMTVVQTLSLGFGSTPTTYYIFFSVIEITCTLFIVWYAWRWSNPGERALNTALDQAELYSKMYTNQSTRQ